MEYTEAKADDIISKYNLSPVTKRTWKRRNTIPKKYLQDDFIPHKPANDITVARLKKYIDSDLFNLKGFGLEKNVLYDLQAGRRRLTEGEAKAFDKGLKQVFKLLESFVDKPTNDNFLKVINDKRIHKYSLFPSFRYQLLRLKAGKDLTKDSLELLQSNVRLNLPNIKKTGKI